jgi:hypothetical protein
MLQHTPDCAVDKDRGKPREKQKSPQPAWQTGAWQKGACGHDPNKDGASENAIIHKQVPKLATDRTQRAGDATAAHRASPGRIIAFKRPQMTTATNATAR